MHPGGESVTHLDQADYVAPHLPPPSRLPYAENDLKKFSRVLDNKAVYRLPQCELREYNKYKKDENVVAISWEDPNTSSIDINDDGFSLSDTIGPDAALIRGSLPLLFAPPTTGANTCFFVCRQHRRLHSALLHRGRSCGIPCVRYSAGTEGPDHHQARCP